MLKKINISPKKKKLIVYFVLILATLAVFWQVNQYDFVNIDDNTYVTENSHVQSGITLDGFRWVFSTKYFYLWHPLVWLSFMFDYQIYDLNAYGYHLTNLILHILSTLLLFWFFNRMTGAIWKSAFVAVFFALHPLHVESVAWISERKDVLSAFFWMLTLCLYVYYTEKPIIKRYLLVIFGFVLALMSKPMVVTLPVVMIFLDYWPLKRFHSQKTSLILWQLREKILFFILSVVLVIVTFYSPNEQEPLAKGFPLSLRLANAPVSFFIYLGKTFWPHDMAVFYPFTIQIPLWQVLGATLLIVAISTAVILMAKRLPYIFVGWLWYTITLFPVIKIVQVGNDAMADRYHYLASIGIAVMLAWGIPLLFPREDTRKKILFPAAIVLIIIMSILTWKQCNYWKNSIALFSHALEVTKDNYQAHINLSSALAGKGKTEEAIAHHDEAIRMMPDHIKTYHYNKAGNSYAALGQYQQAIENYTEAIRLRPDYAISYFNRGSIYINTGQYQLALKDLSEAIRLHPYNAASYNNRAIVFKKLGQYQQAIDDDSKAILLEPNYANAYNNRASVYLNQGNTDSGCKDAQKACALGACAILETAKVKGYCR